MFEHVFGEIENWLEGLFERKPEIKNGQLTEEVITDHLNKTLLNTDCKTYHEVAIGYELDSLFEEYGIKLSTSYLHQVDNKRRVVWIEKCNHGPNSVRGKRYYPIVMVRYSVVDGEDYLKYSKFDVSIMDITGNKVNSIQENIQNADNYFKLNSMVVVDKSSEEVFNEIYTENYIPDSEDEN